MKICEAGRDSCGCNNWSKGIRTINGQYPDDNREFSINAGAGILITPATAGITITNSSDPGALEAGANIELTPNGDHLIIALAQNIAIGNLDVAGDIIQHGAAYETHMEKVYTVNDYIIMRDGAVSGLQSGEYSGFQVKKYDGTNDGRLVIDNNGIARVGDVGDEQPLLTRSESGQLSNGQLFAWDAVNLKGIGVNIDAAPTDNSNNPVSSNGVYDALAGKQDTLTVAITQITPRNDITGVTISVLDNSPIGCRFITYGRIGILNAALSITGTRSGSSNWFDLFPDLDISNYYQPYMISTGQASNLMYGKQFYFQNGQTYNEVIAIQAIYIRVGQ